MTEQPPTPRETLAEEFGQSIDPLAALEPTFNKTTVDPFEVFSEEVLNARDLSSATQGYFAYVFDEWSSHMCEIGRHPACPALEHVEAYIEIQRTPKKEGGRGNTARTIKEKLRKLNRAYQYWQEDPVFPHKDGYNPFELAKKRVPLRVKKTKEHRKVTISELRDMIISVTNLRERTLIMLQLKLGLRAGEVSNLRLEDFRLTASLPIEAYPTLGSHEALGTRTNLVYIPSRDERDGNKSVRPRLLPLDTELCSLLDRYLYARPKNGEPWLFLSKKSHTQMTVKGVNKVWKTNFHPKYAETDAHRPITSHFGRHRFTTYWRVEQNLNRQLVKYLRGDRTGSFTNSSGIDAYLHAYYEDIEATYRADIYKLIADT
ncbi:site-specific integrase [Haloferax sp. ATB1]|uniref:tyrosine-type recombinase/integrase n=1 Tax=Haloferax sp. ATB1 TaxID=1508454 RepID=UPI0005B1FB11|nr:site-specific integrase [Haloferax sp. ATB1]